MTLTFLGEFYSNFNKRFLLLFILRFLLCVKQIVYLFRNIKFNYCILDEGHVIKNGKTKLSKAIKQLAANFRVILSGTPIQVGRRLYCATDMLVDVLFSVSMLVLT